MEVEVKFRDFSDGDCREELVRARKTRWSTGKKQLWQPCMDVQPLFGLVLSWEDCAILVYYLAIKCLVIALVMMSIRDLLRGNVNIGPQLAIGNLITVHSEHVCS